MSALTMPPASAESPTIPALQAIANRLFYAYHRQRQRLDTHLNRCHQRALVTVSRFLSARSSEHVAFFDGRLINRTDLPF